MRALTSPLLDCFLTIMALQNSINLDILLPGFLYSLPFYFAKSSFEDFSYIHLTRNICFNPMKILFLAYCSFLCLLIAVLTVLDFAFDVRNQNLTS